VHDVAKPPFETAPAAHCVHAAPALYCPEGHGEAEGDGAAVQYDEPAVDVEPDAHAVHVVASEP